MKSRAYAVVAADRDHRTASPPRLLLSLAALAIVMFGAIQIAPAAPSQPRANEEQTEGTPPKGDLQTQPPASGVAKSAPGVLKPKTNPDPGMTVATPNPQEFPTPVIRPPGTKGNSAPVVPK